MPALTIAQHHRMFLLHLAIEVVPLKLLAAQVEPQSQPYSTVECSNRQPATRSWPVYKDLEWLPTEEQEAQNPVVALFALVFSIWCKGHCCSCDWGS